MFRVCNETPNSLRNPKTLPRCRIMIGQIVVQSYVTKLIQHIEELVQLRPVITSRSYNVVEHHLDGLSPFCHDSQTQKQILVFPIHQGST